MRCGAVRCGAVRCGAVRCGAVRCGSVGFGSVRSIRTTPHCTAREKKTLLKSPTRHFHVHLQSVRDAAKSHNEPEDRSPISFRKKKNNKQRENEKVLHGKPMDKHTKIRQHLNRQQNVRPPNFRRKAPNKKRQHVFLVGKHTRCTLIAG